MNFQLSEDLELLRETVRDFAAKQIEPFVEQWDADHYLPYEEAIGVDFAFHRKLAEIASLQTGSGTSGEPR